jgi:PEGA domain-containing protein
LESIQRRSRWRFPRLLLAALFFSSTISSPSLAQEATPVSESATDMMARAAELRKQDQVDEAADTFEKAIAQAKVQGDLETARTGYLQLIETLETVRNKKLTEKGGRVSADAYYDKTKKLIEECLRIPELANTQPDSTSVQEMTQHFDEVRKEIFGSFRVGSVNPPDAQVFLDGEPLTTAPGDTRLGKDNLLADVDHEVIVQREGYKPRTEVIDIRPNETKAPDFVLKKKRGKTWYAAWGAGLAGAVVGTTLALTAGGGETTTPPAEPLPGPPDPPSGH